MDDTVPEESKELYSSWALALLLSLTTCSLLLSYVLQRRRIQVIHESVVSIVAGMLIGLVLRAANLHYIREMVTFDHTYFFNMLLPPVILNCGYALNKNDFIRHAIPISAFAFVGTFISALAIGLLAYLYALTGLESVTLTFLECLMVGAILSSTDPVTVLAIFNQLKVDPALYTMIFGESTLNDAVSIVLYESYKRFRGQSIHLGNVFGIMGAFVLVFVVSVAIGLLCGAICALLLKLTHLYRFVYLEICLILVIAYNTYFISNALEMSGIVSLLFCGVAIKHYAYDNMSIAAQKSVRVLFHVMSQLSENFIFIYLGITLFTNLEAIYKPIFIIYMILVILISRFLSIFPLSRFLNFAGQRFLGYREKLVSYEHQSMLFWAGLRGAVAFALGGDLPGYGGHVIRAMILIVVVFSVVVFGGTTPTMIRLLNIPTGVSNSALGDDEEYDAEAQLNPRTTLRRTSLHPVLNHHGEWIATTPSAAGSSRAVSPDRRAPPNAAAYLASAQIKRHGSAQRWSDSDDSSTSLLTHGQQLPRSASLGPTIRRVPSALASESPDRNLVVNVDPLPPATLAPPGGLANDDGPAVDAQGWLRALDSKFIKPLLTRTASPPPNSSDYHPYLRSDTAMGPGEPSQHSLSTFSAPVPDDTTALPPLDSLPQAHSEPGNTASNQDQ
ncbi:monovalent cation:H+ antiporter, CPA1 (nhx1) [Dimargaris verticillata]|uniref:Sodium/hydrogen exchanger n=1 Tax=Dimargaris verticillata TaxID=2761393 RepID=A0A9W8EES9_9FUNG|nr:monovalent cation:H+ antiporter, CPA1 (nhx1) [Dimargaris verticillata]